MIGNFIKKLKDFAEEGKQIKEEKMRKENEKYELLASGELPEIISTNLLLKKNEVCHYAQKADRIIIKTKTTYKTQSAGVSFRVAKGVTIGSRQSYSEPIKTQNAVYYSGDLYITNKRIVFLASEKGAQINIDKITGFQLYNNGLELFVDEKNYKFKINDIKEFAATFDGINQRYGIE